MPEPRHWYLIFYDVVDAKRLRKTYKLLMGWGKPMQFSVFLVRMTKRELERLRFEIARVTTKEDRIMTVRLCNGCAARVTTQGPALVPLDLDPPPFLVV